jgi:DNA-binding NarL/FixJ family response regulator
MAAYDRLGASWDLNRVAQLAREAGVAVPSRHRAGRRGYGGRLSPRELEVAELVATGRTNKEIGADLFIAVSTVEKHLRSISRKLDVHTRTGIARWVSDSASH